MWARERTPSPKKTTYKLTVNEINSWDVFQQNGPRDPGGSAIKNPRANSGDLQVRSLGWEIPWRRKWQPTPVFLPRKSHGQRSLVDYSPRGHKESDTTQLLKNNKQKKQSQTKRTSTRFQKTIYKLSSVRLPQAPTLPTHGRQSPWLDSHPQQGLAPHLGSQQWDPLPLTLHCHSASVGLPLPLSARRGAPQREGGPAFPLIWHY